MNALGDVGINTKEPHAKLHINGTPGEDGLMFPDGTLLTSKFPAPDYDSGWFSFSSQAGVNSYKELTHDLGVYSSLIKVLVKAVDGPNEGFIFEGTGSAQNDDETSSKNYGGVVYAYDTTRIRLWAPDANNDNTHGRIINVCDGWGGKLMPKLQIMQMLRFSSGSKLF